MICRLRANARRASRDCQQWGRGPSFGRRAPVARAYQDTVGVARARDGGRERREQAERRTREKEEALNDVKLRNAG
jgi:hypothetical protein